MSSEDATPRRNNKDKRDDSGKSPYSLQSPHRGRRSGRGGRIGGRDGTGTGRGRFNRNQNKNQNNTNNRRRYNNYERKGRDFRQQEKPTDNPTDEDVLIAFAPLLRSNDVDASRIHDKYVHDSDKASFIDAARKLISSKENNESSETDAEPDTNPSTQETKLNTSSSHNFNKDTDALEHSTQNGNTESQNQVEIENQTDKDPHHTPNNNSHFKPHTPPVPNPPQNSSQQVYDTTKIPKTANLSQENTMQDQLDHLNLQEGLTQPDNDNKATHVSNNGRVQPNLTPNAANESALKTNQGMPPQAVKQNVNTKQVHAPKRLFRNQPGTLQANNKPSNMTITLRPRSELKVRWSLPLNFLRNRAIEKTKQNNPNVTIRYAVNTLSIGLFRLGCPENGKNFAIVAKEVLDSGVFNIQNDIIWGEVPFYAPRSPGNVVLRLYFEDDALHTLATGPITSVEVRTSADVDSTLRFLLSNFKSKKGPNISSMHSLASVLSTFSPPPSHKNQHSGSNNNYDGAGRAAWGCVCESKKAMEVAGMEYQKRKEKLKRQEDQLTKWKEKKTKAEKNLSIDQNDSENSEEKDNDAHTNVDTESDTKNQESEVDNEGKETMTIEAWKEKMNSVMGEKASVERKWRDVQSAYSSILREVISNNSSTLLLRRELITKLRLEYELWCPICEAFAPNPFEKPRSPGDNEETWSSTQPPTFHYPHPITSQHFRQCAQSRDEMRLSTLDFLPRTETLHQLLSHKGHVANGASSQGKSAMSGNTVLQRLTNVMHKLYINTLCPSKEFYEHRAIAKSNIEKIVVDSNAFPVGTKVVLFGSVANGFGSPTSDLDMCIQLPSGSLPDSSDSSGSNAMSILAQSLSSNGMIEVNTSRLSARIPIIMFEYPLKLDNDETLMLQCDISMQNPLACLNTALLKTYADFDSSICVLASIVKLWAKRRNINNPSHHTLSSYGYIIMLLHFLTNFNSSGSNVQYNNYQKNNIPLPILPNLQWIDPNTLNTNVYREMTEKPMNPQLLLRHPTEANFTVNCYFFQPSNSRLRQMFSSNNRSVGYLLASFFRYFAYEFDYKKHVVSLNSTAMSGLLEKEIKAESDGWRLGASSNFLAIEDPFETFYDVAHVLKTSSFQRIRKEFVRAYSKIIEAVRNGEADNTNKGDILLDWICEDVLQQA